MTGYWNNGSSLEPNISSTVGKFEDAPAVLSNAVRSSYKSTICIVAAWSLFTTSFFHGRQHFREYQRGRSLLNSIISHVKEDLLLFLFRRVELAIHRRTFCTSMNIAVRRYHIASSFASILSITSYATVPTLKAPCTIVGLMEES